MKAAFLLFFIYCSFLQFKPWGQQLHTVKGIVISKQTNTRLSGVSVTDLRNNSHGKSNDFGSFIIETSACDTLLFQQPGYGEQRLVITNINDLIVYLQKTIDLQQVNIKGQGKVQELNAVVNNYRDKGLYFDGRPTVWQMFNPWGGAPITGFYELLGKDAANERRFIKFTKEQTEASEIDRRYNKQLVKQVTALPDSDVSKFMQQYTPTVKELNQWNDYQLLHYIRRNLEEFNNEKGELKQRVLE